MAGENLHLSMLLTAQASQARSELVSTTQAVRGLAATGPEINQAMTAAKAALEGVSQGATGLRGLAPEISRGFGPAKSELAVTATAANGVQRAVAGLTQDLRLQSVELVTTARETSLYRSELEAIRAQFNPIFAASKAYEQELRNIAEAASLGALSEVEVAEARQRATAGLVPMKATLLETARGTADYREELEALRAQYNPIFAASKQYEQQLKAIDKAAAAGALSEIEVAQARERAAASIAPVTNSMVGLGRATTANAMASANLAAQFNDIGVMALAMQDPLQLAVQQGTQINQVFGYMGGHREAIRQIGPALLSIASPASLATIAVIALGAAGVQWLLSMRDEAMSVEDALKDLDSAIDELRQAMRLSTPAGLAEAEDRYGRITAAVERLIDAKQRLALIDEQAALQTTTRTVLDQAGGRWYDLGISDAASGVLALRRNLDLGRRDAELLRAEIVRLGTLRDPAEIADQYARLAEMVEAVITAMGPSDERRQFLQELLDGEDRARQIAAILDNHGDTQARRGQQMLADLQSELAIRQAINVYGEDSTRVTELRIDAERRAFEESLRTLDVSDATKDALRASWEAANGLSAVNMSAGIAAARDRARELADELGRAEAASRTLADQGAAELSDARIRLRYADPVEQARQLAQARMQRTQGPLRSEASGAELAALDAEVIAAGNTAAEIARLNEERERQNRNRRQGARDAEQEREAVGELIAELTAEIDILRETDPVQQEMIRHREVLAAATAAERAEIEQLIRTRIQENETLQENQRQMEGLRDLGRDVLRGIISDLREGASAGEILGNVLERLADRLIDMGANSLSDFLFGRSGSSSSGWLGSLIGGFFGGGGIKANALGDVVGSPTLFAYGDGTGQIGVMGEAGAEAIMPLTHAMGEGVGAIADGVETTLPLTRLASGKLGVLLPPPAPFALGGTFGPVPTPPVRTAQPLASGGSAQRAEILGRLEIVHSRDFEVRVSGQMQRIAVEVTEQGLTDYDRNLPARMESIGQDPALRG